MKKYVLMLLLPFFALMGTKDVYASGECGLSCCLAGASASGITLARNLGLSLVYENSYMKTIKAGNDEISPDEAINRNIKPMRSYKVPTEMIMQKYTLVGFVPVTERFSIVASVPYITNDMDMRSRSAMGMVMDMSMNTVSGLGDVSVLGLYTLYTDAPVRPTRRLSAGLGVKAPTGSTNENGGSGALVHAMMQPGSGSWDPLFTVNYMRAFYPLVLQANLMYQWTTEGRNGYEFGDRISYDLSARYQASSYINIGVELNGIHSEKDDDRKGKYSQPDTSMADNPAFTGLDSIFISPLIQAKIPDAGGSAEVRYQLPVYQDVNGFQQVVDWRLLASLSWVF